MKVLDVRDVKKHIGKRDIIKGISFSVNEGEIFGFLGANGAGKTTTIRMLVGLIKQDSGIITICGHDISKAKVKALREVGAVVENPELYKYLSGKKNLMQIARVRGINKEQVDKTVKLVGLEERINDLVSKYSLGMKQRLGLAAALLSEPKLLILDEPTNGLDPTGILDFREVVKKAAKERGMAVFISSHILSEIQNLCDTVAFINNGEIKAIESIKNYSMETENDIVNLVTCSKKDEVIEFINTLDYVNSLKIVENGIEISLKTNSSSELVEALVKMGYKVDEIYKLRKGLEQRYMELVEGGIR